MISQPVQRWVASVFAAICGGAALILIGGATPPATGPDTAVILADTPAPTLAAYHLFLDAKAQEPAPEPPKPKKLAPMFEFPKFEMKPPRIKKDKDERD